MRNLQVDCLWLDGTDPQANLDSEEGCFRNLRLDTALCLFYINDRCIILGRNNEASEWINESNAAEDGIPILRRFSGGGTVYHCPDVLNYSFIAPRDLVGALAALQDSRGHSKPSIRAFTGIVINALSELGPGFAATRTSDISLNGKKISGNAQRIAKDKVLHHGTLMLRCPLKEIERYLAIPPDRLGIEHRGFVTGFKEEGLDVNASQLADLISDSFQCAIAKAGKTG